MMSKAKAMHTTHNCTTRSRALPPVKNERRVTSANTGRASLKEQAEMGVKNQENDGDDQVAKPESALKQEGSHVATPGCKRRQEGQPRNYRSKNCAVTGIELRIFRFRLSQSHCLTSRDTPP